MLEIAKLITFSQIKEKAKTLEQTTKRLQAKIQLRILYFFDKFKRFILSL